MYAQMRVSRGIVLRKFGGALDAMFRFAGVSPAVAARPRRSVADSPLFTVAVLALVAVLAIVLAALLGDLMTGALLATAAPLVTKNREANELIAQADKIVEEIRDVSKPLTGDELKTKTDAVKALRARAAAISEFTPDEEIRRQGGDDGLTPVKPGGDERTDFAKVEDVRASIRKVAVQAFENFGEFMRVTNGKQRPNDKQTRALAKMAELSRAITGDGSAEVLLPLQQESSIFSVSNAQEGILQRARRYTMAGRSLRIPMLEQTDGTNTLNRPMAGKIANVSFIDEAAEKPPREPQFTQRLLLAKKAAAITELGDEILADDFTGQLPSEIAEAVGGQVMNYFNEQFTIDASTSVSTGGPMGALNASNGSLLTVDRDTASDVKVPDVFNMHERLTHGGNAIWFASRRVLRPLMQLTLNGNTLVTWLQSLNQKPQMMLLGYPVVITDLLPTLGTAGDLGLVNPDFYAMALRQGLTVESSIHEKFRYDITVYRFLARAAGVPLPTSTYAYKYASGAKIDEHSPFVRLGLPASS